MKDQGSAVMRRVGRVRAGIHDVDYAPGHVRREPKGPSHGTVGEYAAGCRCRECKDAVAVARRAGRERAKATS